MQMYKPMNTSHIHVPLQSDFYICSSFVSWLLVSLQGELLCAIFFGALLERGLHLHLCIHDEHLGTRLVQVYYMFQTDCNVSHLLFEKLLKQKKKANHSWFIARQRHAWQRTGLQQTNKRTDPSNKSFYAVIKSQQYSI